MSESLIRLPGSSYPELAKIIQGFAHFSGKASNDDVSKLVSIDPTTISRNTGFLIDTGIVTSGNKKEITPIGRRLAGAIEHKIDEEIAKNWNTIIADTPFFETVLSAVRIRGGMDLSTLKSHVAYTAGRTKNKYVMAGAQATIDILMTAGRIAEESGLLVTRSTDYAKTTRADSEIVVEPSRPSPSETSAITIRSGGSAPVSIQIQIQCTPADLDGLGGKLRSIIDDLNSVDEKTD